MSTSATTGNADPANNYFDDLSTFHSRLQELLELRLQTKKLAHLKQSIFESSQSLERDEAILLEITAEKNHLQQEKASLIDALAKVEVDLNAMIGAETAVRQTVRESKESLRSLRNDQFEPLKDLVDSLRHNHDLPRLPSLQEEIEMEMAQYLTQRRERWKDSGLVDADHASNSGDGAGEARRVAGSPSLVASLSSSSTSTPKRARGRPKGSTLSKSAAAGKKSKPRISLTLSAPPQSAYRKESTASKSGSDTGDDDGRGGDSDQTYSEPRRGKKSRLK
ncbi:hypothetical protein BJ742DRAFT_814081 [Cladochytrium replicatum]|nr:hypothetical protein BJ742DRAFT_814081 [Cladochytrium replicatum]